MGFVGPLGLHCVQCSIAVVLMLHCRFRQFLSSQVSLEAEIASFRSHFHIYEVERRQGSTTKANVGMNNRLHWVVVLEFRQFFPKDFCP